MGHDLDTIIKDINEDIILLLKVVNCDSHDRMGQVGSKRQQLVCNTSASSLLLGVRTRGSFGKKSHLMLPDNSVLECKDCEHIKVQTQF